MKQLDSNLVHKSAIALSLALGLSIAQPVLAHHPFGAETPSNLLTGFLSGVGHPVIGVDHLAFVIAVGLLAAITKRGILIPVAFVLATMAGTGVHLLSIDLPFPELIISASVLVFGAVLASKNRLNLGVNAALAAAAGVFHGHAYGEAIFGAEMTPLVAYLAGFALVQLAIALTAFQIGRVLWKSLEQPSLAIRFAGFTICGAGMAFVAASLG
ncbi:MAG: HupE/UreJ family protein [Cyanophyceae cyanobacterium]